MGFSIYSNSGKIAYGIKNFIVDTPSDIENLPTSIMPGCTAFAIETSTYYMLNHQKEWIEVTLAGGAGIVNPDLPDRTYTYVYNGGGP